MYNELRNLIMIKNTVRVVYKKVIECKKYINHSTVSRRNVYSKQKNSSIYFIF